MESIFQPRPVAIVWSEELEPYRPIIENAINRLAEIWPGLAIYPQGDCNFYGGKSVTKLLEQLSDDDGFVNSHKVVGTIAWRLTQGHIVIALTGRTLIYVAGGNPYDAFCPHAGLISLDIQKPQAEIEQAALVLLVHTLGHIFMGEKVPHCDNPDCIMRAMNNWARIQQFPEFKTWRDAFCKTCAQTVYCSGLWTSSAPSRVVRF